MPSCIGETLAHFIQTANVQTNETARGMIWLLPLQAWHVPAVHLVDLGAGAGLNLVAEQRNYRYYADDHLLFLQIGSGQPPQFSTRCSGGIDTLPTATAHVPRIASRLGCDMLPFALDSAEKELNSLLTCGAIRRIVYSACAKALQPFIPTMPLQNQCRCLRSRCPNNSMLTCIPSSRPDWRQQFRPNRSFSTTYITNYLPDKGASLRDIIGRWATQLARSVLWLQWEPTYGRLPEPEYGWIAYSADLWHGATHDQWHLGWVHPTALILPSTLHRGRRFVPR